MGLVVNFVAFQLGWFSSVIGGAQGLPWVGPLAVFVIVTIHLANAPEKDKEFFLILSCGLIGAVFDSLLVASGWVTYPSGMFTDMTAPYWIIAMWVLFGTTLNVSMRWLKRRWLVAAAVGLIAGPLSYIAGQKLGGIVFVEQTNALVALGVGWGLMMPALMRLSDHFDGYESALRKKSAEAAS